MEPLQQVLQKAKAVALYYSGSLWALKQFVTTGRTDAETEYSQEAPGGAPFAGLINQGLTCYLNALLQCLFLTPEFRDRIQEKPWASQPEQALGQIFRGLQRRCGPVPTNALTTCLGLHGSVQQDVAEVFLLLLQHLGRDELQEVFQSEVEKIIQCLVCGHEERIPSGGRMLILPVASHTQLCGLEGAGQKPGKPANPSSGVSQETRFLRLPKVLILQVRELTFENGRFHKIQKPINIAQVLKLHTSPRELTLPKCKASHSGTLTPNPEQRVYHLYAMCCHSGDCSGGHYTALAQPPGRAEWFRFNDQQVHCVGPEFPLHDTFRSETPYLLLYRCQETGDRRDVEPGLGDKGRASEHVDEEGPKAPPPGEQGEARGLPWGPQCSPEEELPAMGMRSSAAEDQALSHPAQGPAQPGKTRLRSKDGGAEAAREGVRLLGDREAEAMATRERGVEIAKEGGQLLRDGGLEAVASREGGGEAVAAREGGWLFRDRGRLWQPEKEEEWRPWSPEKQEQRLWPSEKEEERSWPPEKEEGRPWPPEKEEQRQWPPENGAGPQEETPQAAQLDALPGVLNQLRPGTSLPPHSQPPPHGVARIMSSLPPTAPAPSCPVHAVTASAHFCAAQSRGLEA
ncbi:PREDICTED: ubiquitin carboxyl-terminal hydrolase 64E-like [Colobus angolensis palliatus]|uniref:ubiquitin carboxyl-terminal hydrolase 64E-like n=1 Tax=Colobus angolensis palliatus TaxID=336983 RepID=UPI0005F42816|nr:PREDICTED: ubiquitin carboxyl-terminal hydrolase 64E-like [Colobus angolensis palliatus]